VLPDGTAIDVTDQLKYINNCTPSPVSHRAGFFRFIEVKMVNEGQESGGGGEGLNAGGSDVAVATTSTGQLKLTLGERRELEDLLDRKDREEQVKEANLQWFMTWGFTTKWHMTFNPKKFPRGASFNQCVWAWEYVIVENLNKELYGYHYKRNIGHSYFSYLLGIEPHRSGLLHMHAVTSHRTNWRLARQLYQGGKKLNVGTIEIKPIDDLERDIRYAIKYVTKNDGEPVLFRTENEKEPPFKPYWFTAIEY
jgi:hypothetical protein